MNRKERVKAVYDYINQHGINEKNFSDLYSKLQEEFSLEMEFESDLSKNNYLKNLRQTINKQAAVYMATKAKRPVKGAPDLFKEFVTAFRHDTNWAK